VVEATLAAGASIINDVSGLLYPEIVDSCVEQGGALVVMHTRARPKVRLQDPGLYADVTADVLSFLRDRMDAAIGRGLSPETLIVDPGPDFTKTPAQTVSMLRRLDEVRALGRPVLLAFSRKDFLGAITGRPPREREAATHAAIAHFAVETLAGLRDIDGRLPAAGRDPPRAAEELTWSPARPSGSAPAPWAPASSTSTSCS
jgi:dihydropteroate synthase